MRLSRELAVLVLFVGASCSYEKSDLLRPYIGDSTDGGPGNDASPTSEAGSAPGEDSAGSDGAVAIDGPGNDDVIVLPGWASCETAAQRENQTVDKVYTLFVRGVTTQPFLAYCHGMATATPKTYLEVDSTKNYARYGMEVTTSYSKIRFDPDKLLVDVADRTWATTKVDGSKPPVQSMAYGTAACCDSNPCGVANVDLGELPFVLVTTWQPGGTNPVGHATPPGDSKFREIRGGGTCGWNGPVSRDPATLESSSVWWDLQLAYQK